MLSALKVFLKSPNAQSGQAMIMALISLVIVGIIASITLSLSDGLNSQAKSFSKNENLESLQRSLETLLSTNATCMGVGTPLRGLYFVDAGSESRALFQKASFISNPAFKQNVSIETLQTATSGGPRIIARGNDGIGTGSVFPDFEATITELYITNANEVTTGSNKFKADFYVTASIDGTSYRSRNIGRMGLEFDAGNNLTNCNLIPSAQLACEKMNCIFNGSAPVGKNKCVCGFPAVDCGPQVPGQPRKYLSGIDTSVYPPVGICEDFKVSCLDTKGPGFFLSGVEPDGTPICQPIEDNLVAATTTTVTTTTTTLPPMTCTGGATTTVTAVPAAPAGCYCPVGNTWVAGACTAPSAGLQPNQWTFAGAPLFVSYPACPVNPLNPLEFASPCAPLGALCDDTFVTGWAGSIMRYVCADINVPGQPGNVKANFCDGVTSSFHASPGLCATSPGGAMQCVALGIGKCQTSPFIPGTVLIHVPCLTNPAGSVLPAPVCAGGNIQCPMDGSANGACL